MEYLKRIVWGFITVFFAISIFNAVGVIYPESGNLSYGASVFVAGIYIIWLGYPNRYFYFRVDEERRRTDGYPKKTIL